MESELKAGSLITVPHDRKSMPGITHAISLVQPWAWLIASGVKRIENRTWPTKYRGPLYIHASKKQSKPDYEIAWALYEHCRRRSGRILDLLPPFHSLTRGAIIATANLTDCVTEHESMWFFGPYGFVLDDVIPIKPFFRNGALGIWRLDA